MTDRLLIKIERQGKASWYSAHPDEDPIAKQLSTWATEVKVTDVRGEVWTFTRSTDKIQSGSLRRVLPQDQKHRWHCRTCDAVWYTVEADLPDECPQCDMPSIELEGKGW